ncbi:MAG: NIPSNAP family protein [Caldilineaceae bacterium]
MIYRVRTLNVIAEKSAAYRAILVRAATHLSAEYSGVQVEILENIAGSQRQLHMVTRCDSLAALEAYEAARKDDAAWQAMIQEAQTLQATTEAADALYRVVG